MELSVEFLKNSSMSQDFINFLKFSLVEFSLIFSIYFLFWSIKDSAIAFSFVAAFFPFSIFCFLFRSSSFKQLIWILSLFLILSKIFM